MSLRMKLVLTTAGIVLIAASACTRGDDDDGPTPAPTPTERVEVVSDFQLVGEVDEAFAGTEPDVEVPGPDDSTPDPDADDEASGPTLEPDATPFGSKPPVGGIMRITVEDASDPLTSECGVAAEESVEVFWTTATSFDPDDVLDDIEDEIEGRIAGVSGRILRSAGTDDGRDTPRPTVSVDEAETDSPEATDPVDSGDLRSIESDVGDCVLVADQVGFESPALPTPARTIARRPASTPDPTPEPTRKPEQTREPEETDEPDDNRSPKPTATATAQEQPELSS